jgi:hypothetical protein
MLKQTGSEPLYKQYTEDNKVYETDDVDDLALKVKSLLENTVPRNRFEVVKSIDVEIDVILGI